MNANPVVHFEMPTANGERTVKFYSKVFGWRMTISGPEMGHYVQANTIESDAKGQPTKPGSINGGFFPIDPNKPAQYPSVVIGVENIKETMKNIIDAGGSILGEPMDIPGVGKYVSFVDTEGNRVSILQPSME